MFWFAVMGLGMFAFLKRLFPEKEYTFFRLFSSIFNMYNFYILNAWGIGERAKFSLYAALPLGLLLIYDVFWEKASVIKNGILFGLLYFLLNGGGAFPLFGATLVILGSAFVFFTALRMRKYGPSEILFAVKTIFAFSIPFLLFNAYYILPNIDALRTSFASSVGGQGGIDGLIAWERVISKNASLVNLLRLQGMPDWYDNVAHPYAHWYIHNPLLIAASFIPIVTLIAGFIAFRFRRLTSNRRVLMWFLLLVLPLGLCMSMGTHPPIGFLYELAMKKIPGFVMFRSSFYKFAPALWFPVVVLTGYFLNELLLRFVRNRAIRFGAGFVLILGLLSYHFPYFTTDAFVLTKPFSTRVIIPPYVTTAQAEMQKIIGQDDGVLLLPMLDEGYLNLPIDTYTWGFFSLDILPRNALNRRVIANDAANPMVQALYSAIYGGDTLAIRTYASILHVNYILWRGDVQLSDTTRRNYPPEKAQKALTAPLFTPVVESGPWILYKLHDVQGIDRVSISEGYDVYQGAHPVSPYLFVDPVGEKNPVVQVADLHDAVTLHADRVFIEAECVYCHTNEYGLLVDSISVPTPRIFPNSPLFFIVDSQNQKIIQRTAQSPSVRIDADLALAQNYLAYAKFLGNRGYLEKYRYYVYDALLHLDSLTGEASNSYTIRVRAYLESQIKTVRSLRSVPAELIQHIEGAIDALGTTAWISQAGVYRYFALLDQDADYTTYAQLESDVHSVLRIDDLDVRPGTTSHLPAGLHRIELIASMSGQTQPPEVFLMRSNTPADRRQFSVDFKRVHPTQYLGSPASQTGSLLILKEQFDPGWRLTDSRGAALKATHVEVNGFANGWILDERERSSFTISFAPQRVMYIGAVLSGTGLLLGLIVWIIKKHEHA